jgi:hypothetical protein
MIAIWAVWINGINKTVNSWTRDSLPSNWAEFRDRWHALHAARLALGLLGLGALIILALQRRSDGMHLMLLRLKSRDRRFIA